MAASMSYSHFHTHKNKLQEIICGYAMFWLYSTHSNFTDLFLTCQISHFLPCSDRTKAIPPTINRNSPRHLTTLFPHCQFISRQQINLSKFKGMNRQEVPGSKPRKFITRTILTNPSLISVSMTSLFNPENQALPKIYEALEKKQQLIAENQSRVLNGVSPKLPRQSSLQEKSYSAKGIKMDSLMEAERQFMRKKMSPQAQQRIERSPLLLKKELSKQLSFMSRGSSTPSLLPNSFNFKNSVEIKQKQAAGFNIISNLS